MAEVEKKPAYEVMLAHLEQVVNAFRRANPFDLISGKDILSDIGKVSVLCDALHEMIIPEGARVGIIDRLREIRGEIREVPEISDLDELIKSLEAVPK